MRSARRSAPLVVGSWAGVNAVLAAVLFAFDGPTAEMRYALYWSSVGLVAGLAGVFLWPEQPSRRSGARARGAPAGGAVIDTPANGAPALAIAVACFFGGLAWVFGVYLAYFAAPLVAFCLGRWRLERRQGRGT